MLLKKIASGMNVIFLLLFLRIGADFNFT